MFTLPLLSTAHSSFQCAICYCLYTDPVCLPCSHSFCRACVLKCLEARPQCPLCNSSITNPKRQMTPLPSLTMLSTLVRVAARDGARHAEALRADHPRPEGEEGGGGVRSVVGRVPVRRPSRVNFDAYFSRAGVDACGAANDAPSTTPPRPPHTTRLSPARALHFEGDVAVMATQSLQSASTPARAAFWQNPVQDSPTLHLDAMADLGDDMLPDITIASTTTDATPRLHRGRDVSCGEGERVAGRIAPELPWVVSLDTHPPPQPVTLSTLPTCSLSLRPPLSRADPAAVRAAATRATHATPSLSASSSASLLSLPATRAALDQRFRRGVCFLCGLDTTSTEAMRAFLYSLLTVRAEASGCTPAALRDVTEEILSLDLGPLWELTCAVAPTPAPHDAKSGPQRTEEPCASALAHQNCLAWCGLLDANHYFRGRAHMCTRQDAALVLSAATHPGESTPHAALARAIDEATIVYSSILSWSPASSASLSRTGTRKRGRDAAAVHTALDAQPPLSARVAVLLLNGVPASSSLPLTSRSSLASSPPLGSTTWSSCCTVCGRSSQLDVSLRECMALALDKSCLHACGRRFHLPCALLAGEAQCIVFGLDNSDGDDEDEDEDEDEQGGDRHDTGSRQASPPRRSGGRHQSKKRKKTPPPPVTVWCGDCYRQRARS